MSRAFVWTRRRGISAWRGRRICTQYTQVSRVPRSGPSGTRRPHFGSSSHGGLVCPGVSASLPPTFLPPETDKGGMRRAPLSPITLAGHDSANRDPDTRLRESSPRLYLFPLAYSAPVFVAGWHACPRAVYGDITRERKRRLVCTKYKQLNAFHPPSGAAFFSIFGGRGRGCWPAGVHGSHFGTSAAFTATLGLFKATPPLRDVWVGGLRGMAGREGGGEEGPWEGGLVPVRWGGGCG